MHATICLVQDEVCANVQELLGEGISRQLLAEVVQLLIRELDDMELCAKHQARWLGCCS